MKLVEHYVNTLKSGLPEAQKEDIAQEFSESIHSEMEEKEAELGRPLSEAEVTALLRQRGNPLVIASRYRQDQRSIALGAQIIGPELFPYYTKVLKFNLGVTGLVILVIFAALFAAGRSLGMAGVLSALFWNLLIQLLVITAIFAAIDRTLKKHPERWDIGIPRGPQFRGLEEPQTGPRVPRGESISQIIMLLVGLVWLRAVQGMPFLIFGPAAIFLKAAPVWREVYVPVVVIALAGIAQGGVNLFWPDWVRLRWFVRVGTHAVNLVLGVLLIRAGVWVTAVNDASVGYQQAAAVVNQVTFYCLVVGGLTTIGMLVNDVRRLIAGTSGTLSRKTAAKV